MATYGLRRIMEPAEATVSLPEAKSHLRVEVADDDALIAAFVEAATGVVEVWLQRQLVTATWRLTLDAFPDYGCPIRLPYPRLLAVSSIRYRDTAEAWQTLDPAEYQVDADREPGLVWEGYGEVWPVALDQPGSIEVVYAAGYGPAAEVPEAVKAAIKLLAADLYENRGDAPATVESNPTVERLLTPFRVMEYL